MRGERNLRCRPRQAARIDKTCARRVSHLLSEWEIGQLQRVRGCYCQGRRRFAVASQDVQNHPCRMHIVRQGFSTGRFHCLQPIREHGAEDLDHLPVAAGQAFQLALHTANRDRQIPRLERRSIAQSAGFAGQNGYIMQGIVDGVVAAEDTHMETDDLTVLPALEAIGVSPDLDRSADRAGIDRVTVLVEAHEAGLGY